MLIVARLAGAATPVRAQPQQSEDGAESLVRHYGPYKVRVEAALILGRLRQARSVPALIVGLNDQHPAVRASSARSLGLIGAPDARDPLLAALHDPVPT